ncbi:MAG: ABC transporter substrate-binding protein [Oscillospiraceae bacterium]|nr:ABC transporter substrate-binding protein [Oscillospiraceae bacterium]
MKKRLLALGLGLMLLCSCGVKEKTMEIDGVTFTDALGRRVSVEEPQRVACLLGSFAQVWILAGGDICATADDAWEDFDLGLSDDVVNLGNTKELSLEKLLGSQPDFIIASGNTKQNVEWKETLEATGIPLAYFEVNDFSDYLEMLQICTEITGREDLYEQNGLAVQEQIDSVVEQSKERLAESAEVPTVLTMRASASSILAKNSESTVLGEILLDLGCVNIADSDTSLLENLSIETILQRDPDYIFFIPRGDDEEGMKAYVQSYLMEHPAWAQLSAVKEGRVYYMKKELYGLKPNDRWGEAYEKAEEILSNEA